MPPSAAVKVISTSVACAGSGSKPHSGFRCQASSRRWGGSNSVTKPQSHSLPSASRSNQRPPARGSMIASAAIALPMWWLSSGHQVLKPAVKTSNARSGAP